MGPHRARMSNDPQDRNGERPTKTNPDEVMPGQSDRFFVAFCLNEPLLLHRNRKTSSETHAMSYLGTKRVPPRWAKDAMSVVDGK